MTNEMTMRKRASDAEQKLRNDAKEGKVSLRKWTRFKREYPHGTMSDYKAIQKREREIGSTNKTVFGASEKPVEKAEKRQRQRPPRRQAKQMLGADPNQQDDLLCANQQWLDHSPNPAASGERMFDPSGVSRGWLVLGFDWICL